MKYSYRAYIKYLLFLFVMVFCGPNLMAQPEKLSQLEVQLKQEQLAREDRIAAYLLQNGLQKRIFLDSSKTISEIIDVRSGVPYFYITTNRTGGELIKTDRVYPGGSANLNLTGANQTLGIWDGGGVRTSHQEFTNRVTQKDVPAGVIDHATHVAGTMIAAGIATLSDGTNTYPQGARGMSYAANLWSYDWNNDNAEMASAANNGIQVSQHSYGLITGWAYGNWSGNTAWHWWGDAALSTTIDARFGYYDQESRNWDLIANAADEYLIVKSAGNDRGEGPAPGTVHYFLDPTNGYTWTQSTAIRNPDGNANGYDCITDAGNAKNILTIGAVDLAGAMASFSGWGPTDDGRVKPDLVAKGVGVLSTGSFNDADYFFSNGTSMSGPMVSGAMGLLLEHQANLFPNKKLKASTLKALSIHTANNRVGGSAEGPDYRFGWGLLDVEKAALTMTAHKATGIHIFEEQLAQGEELFIPVQAKGTEPLRVTIVWNDPAGVVATQSLNNTTPKLVNDLDVRILETNQTYEPYILDPANPANAATRGDNFRDNVEMVHIENPAAGSYLVKIAHKGTLANGQQAFSIIIMGNEALTSLADLSLIPATAKLVVNGVTTINGNLEVSAIKTPASGQLVLTPNSTLIINDEFIVESDGQVELRSDATGYAQLKIDPNANISVLGTLTQEQWISGTGWRNIGLSLFGQQAQDLGAVSSTAIGQNFTKWDAASSEWVAVLPNEPLQRGTGYATYVGDFGIIADNEKVIAEGTPAISFNPSLDYHDGTGTSSVFTDPAAAAGWNFIANPFTAGLDFSAIPLANFSNVQRAFYIWNPAKGLNGGYEAWSAGASPNDIPPIIPPMQGFWVQTSAPGASLGTLTSTYTTVATPSDFLKRNEVSDHIVLELHHNNKKLDHLTLALIPNSKIGFDANWDAIKKLERSNEMAIFSKSGLYPLAINAIPFQFATETPLLLPLGFGDSPLPLSLKVNKEFLSFDASIYLWNKTDGQLLSTEPGPIQLPFGSQKKEWMLVLSNNPIQNKDLLQPIVIQQNDKEIQIITNGYTGSLNAVLMDINGREIVKNRFVFDVDAVHLNKIATESIARGVYVLHLTLDNGETIVQKMIL